MTTDDSRTFQVTDKARAQLKVIIGQRHLDPGRCLRLAIPPAWTGDGDFGIVIDSRGSGDVSIAHDQTTVLLIEREVADQLARSVLDFKETPMGPAFTLDVY
jgi:Fe-S cluster assembly iron-binding protein IscA